MATNREPDPPGQVELSMRCIIVDVGGRRLVGTLNQRVGGSSPPRPTSLFGRFPSIGSARNAFGAQLATGARRGAEAQRRPGEVFTLGTIKFRGRAQLISGRAESSRALSERSEEHTSELQSLAYLVCR